MLASKRGILGSISILGIFLLLLYAYEPNLVQPLRQTSIPAKKGIASLSDNPGDIVDVLPKQGKDENNGGSLSSGSNPSLNGNSNLEKNQQSQNQKSQNSSLEYVLQKEFPYNRSAFPSFLWQSWKWDPSSGYFDDGLRTVEATWTQKNPLYLHKVLNDEMTAELVHVMYENVSDVISLWNKMPAAILKADLFRYLVLLARGGVYTDIDTENIKPIREWIPLSIQPKDVGLVVGIEADPDREDWTDWYSRRVQLCQWTIRAKKGHPALAKVIDMINKHSTDELLNKKYNVNDVIEWSGPAIWTDAVMEYLNENNQGKVYSWHNFTGITEPILAEDVLVLPITGMFFFYLQLILYIYIFKM